MFLVKSSLALATGLTALAALGATTSAEAQEGRILNRCEAQCSSALFQNSCLQYCETERLARKRKRLIIVRVPEEPKPVPFIFEPNGGGEGGRGGGGGGRGK